MAYENQTVQLPDTYILDPNEGWNAGAISLGLLDGDATYRFQVPGTVAGVVTGLSDPAFNQGFGYQEIQYAFYISNGGYRIMEGGIDKTAPVASTGTTVYSIIRAGESLYYAVDGTVVYQSLIPVTSSFVLVDASLYAGGDAIADAEITEVYICTAQVLISSTLGAVSTVTSKNAVNIPITADMAVGIRLGDNVYLGANIPVSSTLSAALSQQIALTAAIDVTTSLTATSSLPRSDGADVSFQALASWGNDHPASQSAATFEALESEAAGGLVTPRVASSNASFAGIITAGHVLTGEVATATTATFQPLDTIAADHNYGESSASLFGFTSRGGQYVLVDGAFQGNVPGFSVTAIGEDSPATSVYAEVPAITLSAYNGSGLDKNIPALTLTASATSVPVGRVTAFTPAISVQASGITGALIGAVLTVPNTLSITAYAGGYAKLAIPKISTATASTEGSVGTFSASTPLITSYAEVFPSDYGRATLDVPVITSLYGVAYLDTPAYSITASIFQAPTGFTGYAMNVANGALSRYPSYNFDSMFRFNGEYYGILNNTMFALNGASDNGLDIDSVAEVSPSSFNKTELKRLTYTYVGGRANQAIQVEPVGDEKIVGTYLSPALDRTGTHTRRVTLPRGARARYWGLRISNVAGDELDIESIEYKTELLTRRT